MPSTDMEATGRVKAEVELVGHLKLSWTSPVLSLPSALFWKYSNNFQCALLCAQLMQNDPTAWRQQEEPSYLLELLFNPQWYLWPVCSVIPGATPPPELDQTKPQSNYRQLLRENLQYLAQRTTLLNSHPVSPWDQIPARLTRLTKLTRLQGYKARRLQALWLQRYKADRQQN